VLGNLRFEFDWRYSTTVLIFLLASLGSVLAQRFHDSDPLLIDNDRLVDVVEEPELLELSDMYDRFGHMVVKLGDPKFSESQNVNTLDEVPDNSWFTNRHARNRLSLEELVRGANFDGPPAVDEEWHVFRGKSQGVTPGFHIEDSKGDRYVIKFDPPHLEELATAAEAIASRIFYALGYNVPQNYVVYLNPDSLHVKEGVMVADTFGDEVPLTQFRLKRMMRLISQRPDGTLRVLASKYFDGKPIGPFRYYGTRSDDPNDVILHEHRRELRGLRLFAAWTNHDDTRAQNTQDAWQEADGKYFISHYLMDFGSTFGSGSVMIQRAPLGFSYSLDVGDMKYNAPRFGIPVPEYRKVKWPKFPQYQAVGRWEADHFDPQGWKNDYPNPAFVRMTARDAFWAAKIMAKFSSAELRAIVKMGQYSDPENERYFHEVLVKRQIECVRFGISGLNPLDEFRVAGNRLEFTNLAEDYGLAAPGATRYKILWHSYDNHNQRKLESLGGPVESDENVTPLPPNVGKGLYLLAEITSLNEANPHWADPVKVYLRPGGKGYEVVGIERETPQEYIGVH